MDRTVHGLSVAKYALLRESKKKGEIEKERKKKENRKVCGPSDCEMPSIGGSMR